MEKYRKQKDDLECEMMKKYNLPIPAIKIKTKEVKHQKMTSSTN